MIELSETSNVYGKQNEIYQYFINQANYDDILSSKLFIVLADYMLDKYGEDGITLNNLCYIQPNKLCNIMNKSELLYEKLISVIGQYKISLIMDGKNDIGFPMKKYKEALNTYMGYATNKKHVSKLKRKEKIKEDFIDLYTYYKESDKYEEVTQQTTTPFVERNRNLKFGKLTTKIPFRRTDIGDMSIYWLCQCDCGNWIMLQKADLKHIKSCGCDTFEENYIGKKIDTLTCIDQRTTVSKNGNRVMKLKIQCDCGNIKLMDPSRFLQGNNCGRWCDYSIHYNDGGKNFNQFFRNGTNVSKLGRTESNRNSTTGYIGVTYNSKYNNYTAYITFQHKPEYLGTYTLKETAAKVRLDAQKILQGECITELEKDEFVQNNKYLMKLLERAKLKLNSIK